METISKLQVRKKKKYVLKQNNSIHKNDQTRTVRSSKQSSEEKCKSRQSNLAKEAEDDATRWNMKQLYATIRNPAGTFKQTERHKTDKNGIFKL